MDATEGKLEEREYYVADLPSALFCGFGCALGGRNFDAAHAFANDLGLEAMSNVEFTRRWLIAYCLFARL